MFLNPDLTPETVVLTSCWDCIDEFAEVLYYEISSRPSAAHDFFLEKRDGE